MDQASLQPQGSTIGSRVSGIPATANAALEELKALEGAESITQKDLISASSPVDDVYHDCTFDSPIAEQFDDPVADDAMTQPLAQLSDSRAHPQYSAGGAVPVTSVGIAPTQDSDGGAHLLISHHLAAPESTDDGADAASTTAHEVVNKAASADSSAAVTATEAVVRIPVSTAGSAKEAAKEAVANTAEVTPITSCVAVRESARTLESELTVEGNSGGSSVEGSREEANTADSAARHPEAYREAVEASVLSFTVTDVQSAAAVREAELSAEVDAVIEHLVIHTVAAVTSAAVTPVVRNAVEAPAINRSSGQIPVGPVPSAALTTAAVVSHSVRTQSYSTKDSNTSFLVVDQPKKRRRGFLRLFCCGCSATK